MQNTKNRSVVIAITETGMTIPEAATRYNVSTRWIRTLLARYRAGGLEAVDHRSRRPHSNPNATDPATVDRILTLRRTLTAQGLDAGAESIFDRLPEHDRPSLSTIWRILTRHNTVPPQPQKRPRSSWHRFQADRPNETWQSDFTH